MCMLFLEVSHSGFLAERIALQAAHQYFNVCRLTVARQGMLIGPAGAIAMIVNARSVMAP